jgi:hypothetical protein
MRKIFVGAVLFLCALAVEAQVQPRPGGSSQITGVSGNGHSLATTSGPLTLGHCVTLDAFGNLIDAGSACGTSSGGISGLTTGKLPKATSGSALGDSLFDDGLSNANGGTYGGSAGFFAKSYNSTDTVNNGSVKFGTGSGGDSTCPAPASGTSYLCTKSSGISASINGGSYAAIQVGAAAGGSGLFAGIMGTLPTASGTGLSTALNHSGTYANSNVGTGILISEPTGVAGTNLEGQLVSYPGTAFTLTALFSTPLGQSNTGFGISISQSGSTGKSIWFGPFFSSGSWSNLAYTFSAPNTLGSSLASAAIPAYPFIWLRLKDDGTNITFYYSFDGIVWTQEYQVAKSSSYMAGNFNYLGAVLVTGSPQSTVLQSWTITTP